MKKTLIALALVAMAAPFAASASESNGIGYTYAQLDYVYSDASAYHGDSDGAVLSGSYGFTDNIFGFASYGEMDDKHYDYDRKTWTVGAGFNQSIGTRADWVTKVGLARTRWDGSFYTCAEAHCDTSHTYRRHGHDNSAWVSTGVLGRLTDRLSANAYLGYKDTEGNRRRATAFGDFGAVYSFNKTWGLHGSVTVDDGGTDYGLGVRASF